MRLQSLLRGAGLLGTLAAFFAVCALVLQIDTGHAEVPVLIVAGLGGCLTAMFSVGLVLIYRATRVINFAHAAFGLVGGILFYELITFRGYSYWIALPAGLAAACLGGAVMELLFIRRFFGAPRLVLTVVTIGIGQLLVGLAGAIPGWLGDKRNRPTLPRTPFSHLQWKAYPVVINGNLLFAVAVTVVVLAAMIGFFRFTSVGIAVRAAAENDDRASLLGVNTRSLSTLVWAMGGLLAGLSIVLLVPINGSSVVQGGAGLGLGFLLVGLIAAVVASMDDLPVTVVAALCLNLFDTVIFITTRSTEMEDLANLVLLIVILLVRSKRLARTDESSLSTWAAIEEVRPVPRELARVPSVRSGGRWFVAALAIIVFGYPWVMSPSQTNMGSYFLITGIVIISLVILTGWGGMINLGAVAFMAVGALIGGAAMAKAGWPLPVALVLGSSAGAVVAIILGLTSLRIRGLYLAVTTLAFAIVVENVFLSRRYFGFLIADRVNRPSLLFVHTEDDRAFFYLCLAVLGLAWWAALGLRRHRTGRVLIAMRDNERAAQAFGVNLVKTRLVTFALSGFLAAGAGVLFAAHQHQVNATAFTPDDSIQIFLIAIIGGLGSIQGALLGSVYFTVVNLALHGAVAKLFASSLGVLLVLMFFPGGLGSLAYKVRDSILRRVAIRRRIYVPSLLADRGIVPGSDRAPLAPIPSTDGRPVSVPVVYRLPSRIGLAGASQSGRRWTFDG